MSSVMHRKRGFTLIELMVTLTVIVVLLLIAVPSFRTFQQRAATRSAADQALNFWNQSRLEAAKRNLYVTVGAVTSGSNYCLGANTEPYGGTPPAAADVDACDCFEDDSTDPDFCNVARYPAEQGEWGRVSILGTPTLGGSTGLAVIEPKNTMLTELGDAGAVTFAGPPGLRTYRLNLRVDGMGRAVLCESTATGVDRMSDYGNRRCTP